MTEEAWQKAIGLVNFTRGQKADAGPDPRPRLLRTASGSPWAISRRRERREDRPADAVQLPPAIARFGDYLVLSSTDGLAKDLIDALKSEMAEPRHGRRPPTAWSRWTVDALAVDPGRQPPESGPAEHDRKGHDAGAGRGADRPLRRSSRRSGQARFTLGESTSGGPRQRWRSKLNLGGR